MDAVERTYKNLASQLSQIVAERRSLAATGAEPQRLEENQSRLARVQSELSRLLLAGETGVAV